jgi:hypothetical protein
MENQLHTVMADISHQLQSMHVRTAFASLALLLECADQPDFGLVPNLIAVALTIARRTHVPGEHAPTMVSRNSLVVAILDGLVFVVTQRLRTL